VVIEKKLAFSVSEKCIVDLSDGGVHQKPEQHEDPLLPRTLSAFPIWFRLAEAEQVVQVSERWVDYPSIHQSRLEEFLPPVERQDYKLALPARNFDLIIDLYPAKVLLQEKVKAVLNEVIDHLPLKGCIPLEAPVLALLKLVQLSKSLVDIFNREFAGQL
jgi:hypothetical protein